MIWMSFKPLRAMIGLIAALASLYVIYGTFGTALMVFKNSAVALLPNLTLSGGWHAIGSKAADNFDLWFGCIWVVGVALIVYMFLSIISSTDYDRPQQ
jgi:hypothetical protein